MRICVHERKGFGKIGVLWLFRIAVVGLSAPAMANISLTYDLNAAYLDYAISGGSKTLTVTHTVDSIFDLYKVNGAEVDGARVVAAFAPSFALTLVLNMEDLTGADKWGGTGSLMFTDKDPGNVAEAYVKVTSAEIRDGNLEIHGVMSDWSTNTSILMPPGDPWTFQGNYPSSLGTPNEDGVTGQITVNNADSFDNGTLLTLKFSVGTGSMDGLFGSSFQKTGGEVKGSIVPAPGAVLLGLLGFSLIGWVRRRFA